MLCFPHDRASLRIQGFEKIIHCVIFDFCDVIGAMLLEQNKI
jgi:hypothetical protein